MSSPHVVFRLLLVASIIPLFLVLGARVATSAPLPGTNSKHRRLTASPSSLSFGSIQLGSSQIQYETLTNSGNSTVTISQATVTGAGFGWSGLALPLSLNKGQSVTFSALFAPKTGGSASGAITVVSNASNPNLTIALAGAGISAGRLTSSASALNFGIVTVGASKSLTTTLTATASSVTVSSATSTSAEFRLTGLSLPKTIAAGQSASFALTFTPQSSGAASGSISLASNASNTPTVETLTGSGTATQAGTVGANNYYISPSGSDYNTGTSSGAPWKTFAHAIPLLNPGYTLNLLNGTYNTTTGTGLPFINCLSGARNGTAGNPITLQAVNERQAWIKGDGSREPFRVSNCSYWNIVGLHISDDDFPSEGAWTAIADIEASSHLVIKRNIFDHDNRCYNDQLLGLVGTSNSQIIENEIYYFHRDGMQLFSNSNGNEIARNYSNSRLFPDGPTTTGCTPRASGDATRGDTGVHNYGDSNNIWENNISENNSGGLSTETVTGGASSINNTWLENISLNDIYGIVGGPHTTAEAMTGLVYTNNVVINPSSVGSYLRGAQTTTSHGSFFLNSSTAAGGVLFDQGNKGASTFRANVDNTQVVGGTRVTGFLAVTNQGTWTGGFDHVNSFNNGSNFSTGGLPLTNSSTVNPGFGSCYLWVPATSPLKRAGSGGSDIGANILYAYQGGSLTTTKLWTSSGAFAGQGAIVAGLNNVPGSSLFDIGTRLNVNQNGCSFPAGY